MTLGRSSYNWGRMEVNRDVALGDFDFSATCTGRWSLIGVLWTPLLRDN